jgi:uncharacterized protein YjbJ (UPF0337 family)
MTDMPHSWTSGTGKNRDGRGEAQLRHHKETQTSLDIAKWVRDLVWSSAATATHRSARTSAPAPQPTFALRDLSHVLFSPQGLGVLRCGITWQPHLPAGDPSFDPDQSNRSGTRAVNATAPMPTIGDAVMDKDRIAGSAKKIKGSIKETIGKATGDAKLEAEGRADKVEGKIQNAIGGLKDTLKDALND